jgi:hypothetical protein
LKEDRFCRGHYNNCRCLASPLLLARWNGESAQRAANEIRSASALVTQLNGAQLTAPVAFEISLKNLAEKRRLVLRTGEKMSMVSLLVSMPA